MEEVSRPVIAPAGLLSCAGLLCWIRSGALRSKEALAYTCIIAWFRAVVGGRRGIEWLVRQRGGWQRYNPMSGLELAVGLSDMYMKGS